MGVAVRAKNLSSLGHCSRWLIVMLGVLNFIAGAVVAGLGLYFLFKENDVSAIMGYVFMTVVAATLVAAGLLMILCGLMGLIGGFALSTGAILIFISLLAVVCFLLIGGAVMALAFKSQINEEVRNAMLKSLDKYGGRDEEKLTRAWDRTQRTLYCCAVDEQDWPRYRNTPWFKELPGEPGLNKPFVPESCCLRNQYDEYINKEQCQLTKDDPPGVKNGIYNEALHYQGCYTAAKNHAAEYFVYATGIGFGVVVVTVISLIFAVLLLLQLRKSVEAPRQFHTEHKLQLY